MASDDSLFFDYELPEARIAQEPLSQRDESRLLVIDRAANTISHRQFRDLSELLRTGDLLVLNNTRVLPARVVGHREQTGGRWHGLFLQPAADHAWEMIAQTRGYPQAGEWFVTETGLRLQLVGRTEKRHWLMRPEATGSPQELLAVHGHIPLPHYIRHGQDHAGDREHYQTVYAQNPGSVAAPTAGLHFTPTLLDKLTVAGISTAFVTLHVGLGTFAPIKTEDPRQHQIHAEWCEVSAETANRIRETKARGGRVLAVGTTTTRTLESAARTAEIAAYQGESSLFIYPPFDFKVIDGLITNFHLPRTSLLLLVQALSGSEILRRAYEEAIQREYRFFSYGDAMLVV